MRNSAPWVGASGVDVDHDAAANFSGEDFFGQAADCGERLGKGERIEFVERQFPREALPGFDAQGFGREDGIDSEKRDIAQNERKHRCGKFRTAGEAAGGDCTVGSRGCEN